MPFDRTPSQSTYQTKMIPLVKEMNGRLTTLGKDEDFVNIFPELVKNRTTNEDVFKLIKRDGSSLFISLPGIVRGCYFWKDQNRIFVAVSDDVYVYNASTGALVTTLNTIFATTTAGVVGFCEFLYDTGEVKIVVTDGTTLSTIDSSNVVVAGADADMPVHLPIPIFLDGYLFIVKVSTADIYNSNLNNPLLYTAGDFLTAEMRADQLVSIAILNNYLVAFGNGSIEYFWDAAVATGSPMQRNDTPIKLTGFLGGLTQLGNKAYFVGEDEKSMPDVFVLEDFKIKNIGSEFVRRHLSSLTTGFSTALKGTVVSFGGHDFYVLDTGELTFYLELETGLWGRLSFGDDTDMQITHALNITTSTTFSSLFILSGIAKIYRFSPTLYQDDGTTFTCYIVTDKNRFDTFRNKFMSKLVVWCNRPASSAFIKIQWSDDDYTTYNTGSLIDISKERPTLTRLGRFRERAFKLTFAENAPLLLQAMEADINMGSA